MAVGFRTFKNNIHNVLFSVKNISDREIKIFGRKLKLNQVVNLMDIPEVSEADIKHSLAKGDLLNLLSLNQISIVDSNIDLNSFSSEFIDFLTTVGIPRGVVENGAGITLINGDPGPQIVLNADNIEATTTRLWLSPTQSTQISEANDHVNTIGNAHGLTAADINAIPSSEKGAADGVATLNSSSKIPPEQLPAAQISFKGLWNANTNSPMLQSGMGTDGDFYFVSVAGNTNLDGYSNWLVGDQVIFSNEAGSWLRIGRDDSVLSVNGQSGIVSLDSDDISEGVTNLYVTVAEKAALSGTNGSPNVGNEFVTDTDSRMSDARTPTGAASGDLSGTYPSPTVSKITLGSDAQGDVYYRNSSGALSRLPAGSIGQALITGGAGADPSWNSAFRKIASVTPSGGILNLTNSLLNNAILIRIIYNVIPSASSSIPWLRFNNNSNSVYSRSSNRNGSNNVVQSVAQYSLIGNTSTTLSTAERAFGIITITQYGGGLLQFEQSAGTAGTSLNGGIVRISGAGIFYPSPVAVLSQITILMSATTIAAGSTMEVWISS